MNGAAAPSLDSLSYLQFEPHSALGRLLANYGYAFNADKHGVSTATQFAILRVSSKGLCDGSNVQAMFR